MTMEPSDAETCLHVSISEANMSSPVRGMTCKASAARMRILILIAKPQQSSPVRGMTTSGEQKNGVPGGAPFLHSMNMDF